MNKPTKELSLPASVPLWLTQVRGASEPGHKAGESFAEGDLRPVTEQTPRFAQISVGKWHISGLSSVRRNSGPLA
jgi:hypothetical protein